MHDYASVKGHGSGPGNPLRNIDAGTFVLFITGHLVQERERLDAEEDCLWLLRWHCAMARAQARWGRRFAWIAFTVCGVKRRLRPGRRDVVLALRCSRNAAGASFAPSSDADPGSSERGQKDTT